MKSIKDRLRSKSASGDFVKRNEADTDNFSENEETLTIDEIGLLRDRAGNIREPYINREDSQIPSAVDKMKKQFETEYMGNAGSTSNEINQAIRDIDQTMSEIEQTHREIDEGSDQNIYKKAMHDFDQDLQTAELWIPDAHS